MNKIELCYGRIRVIRGVNGGMISHGRLNELFEVLELDPEERQRVMLLMEKDGVTPVDDEIFEERMAQKTAEPRQKEQKTQIDWEKIRPEKRRDRLEEAIKAMNDDPSLKDRLAQAEEIFRGSLKDTNNKFLNRTAYRRTARALLNVSERRAREGVKKGWLCGTYLSSVRASLERHLERIFSEQELWTFIECCEKGGELSSYERETMLILLRLIPKIMVNPIIA